MKLTSFTVNKFRNIITSGDVAVQDDVTCLVGKNESGKTAVLNALYRLNPSYGDVFDISDHYPRWLLTKDRKAGTIGSADTISGTFELSSEDIAAVESALGPDVLKDNKFTYIRGYEGTRAVVYLNDEQVVANVYAAAEASKETQGLLGEVSKLSELRDKAAEKVTVIEATGDYDEDQLNELIRVRDIAIARLDGKASAWQVAVSTLKARMPKFFYFSQYSVLPGRISLDDIDAAAEGPGQSGTQTARALLALAGTSTGSLREDDYEERKAELEAVSNDLTGQVFEYWSQNEQLEVAIDVDKQNIEQQTPYGQSVTAVTSHLDIRVKDKRHGFTSNFGQRSAGFQWFFSFLAAFSEFNDNDNVVVLLDEPGLALHAKAQADFLRFIDERLAPSVQVLYTTHSPFMVETAKLERVRVVEDKGPKIGSTVSSEVLSVDNDTIFPLQAALGYDISQSLFIGPNNLLVEGTSDFTYLTLVSDHLKSKGREGLDDAWRILPTGGASNVPAFVALMGRNLDVTVLVDSGAQGMQRLTNLAATGLLNKKRLLTIGQIIGAKEGDIEDLFSVVDYLKIYNSAFGTKILKSKLAPGTRVIDRISRTEGTPFVDHGKPADHLLRNRISFIEKLTDETLDNFESAFKLINSTKGN